MSFVKGIFVILTKLANFYALRLDYLIGLIKLTVQIVQFLFGLGHFPLKCPVLSLCNVAVLKLLINLILRSFETV
ncbi:hypothetical protein D3C72_1913120 [compost metagenome]